MPEFKFNFKDSKPYNRFSAALTKNTVEHRSDKQLRQIIVDGQLIDVKSTMNTDILVITKNTRQEIALEFKKLNNIIYNDKVVMGKNN